MNEARALLARHGKSFWFASRFMEKGDADDAAQLYAACRILDDLADEDMPSAEENVRARQRLQCIREELFTPAAAGDDPVTKALKDLHVRRGVNLDAAAALITALTRDADTSLQLDNQAELLRYCYGAAGTVGVMMAPLIGAPSDAWPHAIDLGIAMQLTNIARDIQEDARLGRRYVPGDWVDQAPPAALDNPAGSLAVKAAAANLALLELADTYYQSGADGFQRIPIKNRRAIAVAAEVYRGIGLQLRTRQGRYWEGRAMVSLPGKVRLAARRLTGHGHIRPAGRPGHDSTLHAALAGLPGTHPPSS
ncbi:squalene/phytoene synthase family protein [Larsenimonas rhizosphaerae]|uniref:Squalene/phytoene synthase family protein n=1 Tax=Larsenimonas rhizosphaerae TaxID=2944682 RepID=A0AA42CTN5_9GAMM|nr:squalene/phytoene synthase family protein [Larsenimonas rhizosphaerae]MCX2523807.1 squalene/phytoene synthase family protein [Larsenimonas rhizosphaerae]